VKKPVSKYAFQSQLAPLHPGDPPAAEVGLYKLNAVDTHGLKARLVWRLNP
jgi:hypothetical protein